jgi:hypothetical protein
MGGGQTPWLFSPSTSPATTSRAAPDPRDDNGPNPHFMGSGHSDVLGHHMCGSGGVGEGTCTALHVERHNTADLRRHRDRTPTGLDALAPMRTANRSENGDILVRSGWGVVRLPATFFVVVVPGQGWRLRHHAVTRSGLDVVPRR